MSHRVMSACARASVSLASPRHRLSLPTFCVSDCPTPCKCRSEKEGIYVNCNFKDLSRAGILKSKVPCEIPLDTIELDLSYHHIKKLDPTNFRNCSNLSALFLHHGSLQSIASGTFDNLTSLKHLSMHRNRLHFTRPSLPFNLFSPLSNLQSLHMDLQNVGKYMEKKFDDFRDIIQELPLSLKSLKVDVDPWPGNSTPRGICDESVYPLFSRFVNLEYLSLHRSYECRSYIANETFRSLAELPITHLTIKYLKLTGVEPLAFSWFKDLTHLNMSGTRGMSVADFYPAFMGLQMTNISKLILSSVNTNMKYSDPVILNSTFLSHFVLPQLTSLDLSDTNIHTPKSNQFLKYLKNLQYLYLSKNNIGPRDRNDRVTFFTDNLPNLRLLDISSQSTSRSNTLRIPLSTKTRKLDMSGFNTAKKPLSMRYIGVFHCNSLSEFIFSHNSLVNLDFLLFYDANSTVPLTLDLSNNRLTTISPKMLAVSLSNNLRLDKLLLANNQLGKHFANDIKDTLVVSSLRILDLSNNGFRTLPKASFMNLPKLEYLNLSGNLLDAIEFAFEQMSFLSVIDLSDNRISHLSDEVLVELMRTGMGSRVWMRLLPDGRNQVAFTVNLTGNVFECSCGRLASLDRMRSLKVFSNFDKYYCFRNGERTTFEHIHEVINQLQSQCDSPCPSDIANTSNVTSTQPGALFESAGLSMNENDSQPHVVSSRNASPTSSIIVITMLGVLISICLLLCLYCRKRSRKGRHSGRSVYNENIGEPAVEMEQYNCTTSTGRSPASATRD